jgi:diaminohydroxyphosphoribosylaminopyrimidine deaminase/5-amino-6-(5-phosphoribosylamino)uracil reductase
MMRRAIDLARQRLGRTWPNPAVGCVLVKDGLVLAEAATGEGGRPHAEEQAIMAAGSAARGSDAYVTLEPCGRRSSGSASCSERLVAAGVARVAIACDNPDPLSAGLGVQRLRAAGIEVLDGFLAQEAQTTLYRGFRHRLATGLPLVEFADSGAGYDALFEPEPGEDLEAALRRYGQAGYGLLWTPAEGPAARGLAARAKD